MFPSITPRVNEYQWAQSRCAIFGAATGKKALFQDPSIHNLLDKKNVILQKLLERRKFIGHNHRFIIVGHCALCALCALCTVHCSADIIRFQNCTFYHTSSPASSFHNNLGRIRIGFSLGEIRNSFLILAETQIFIGCSPQS